MPQKASQTIGLVLSRILHIIEHVGNKLPHPATLFASFAFLVIIFSWVFTQFEFTATHPTTGKIVAPNSLLNAGGLRRIVTSLVPNFTGFLPLGTVLVAMLGVGVAEQTGLLGAALRAIVLSASKRFATLLVVFAGVMSNAASEAGYVIVIPLAAVIFLASGRHPLAGLAAAFAAVSGGYSANLVLGTVDPLLAGITTETARIILPGYTVHPTANYYFMAVSAVLITILGTIVTEKIVEPRLGRFSGERTEAEDLTPPEKRGLRAAGIAFVVVAGLVVLAVVPAGAPLRHPETGGLANSPFLSGIVAIIFVTFFVPGIVYGVVTRSVRNDADVINAMGKTMSTLGVYIVVVFFAAQFVAVFSWTNLGIVFAVKGAGILREIGLTGIPLVVAFIFASAVLNLFMGSASAKWAIMAPVFVPMFMLLGYAPELTQVAYRIGDSATNIITPMMSYFALIVAFAQKYKKDARMGTIIAMMLPYTIVFLFAWSLLLVGWVLAGLPLGPGAGVYFDAE